MVKGMMASNLKFQIFYNNIYYMKYLKYYNVFENKIYITANEVPFDIMSWARGKIGTNFTKNKARKKCRNWYASA